MFSIEQIADRLGLHVKTVRNYVREGKLKAVRIGKQYRIAAADLAALTGQPLSAFQPESIRRSRHIEVSSVIEVSAASPELGTRITNLLLPAANSRSQGNETESLRVQTIYDPMRGQLKVILIGGLESTTSAMKLVTAVVGD